MSHTAVYAIDSAPAAEKTYSQKFTVQGIDNTADGIHFWGTDIHGCSVEVCYEENDLMISEGLIQLGRCVASPKMQKFIKGQLEHDHDAHYGNVGHDALPGKNVELIWTRDDILLQFRIFDVPGGDVCVKRYKSNLDGIRLIRESEKKRAARALKREALAAREIWSLPKLPGMLVDFLESRDEKTLSIGDLNIHKTGDILLILYCASLLEKSGILKRNYATFYKAFKQDFFPKQLAGKKHTTYAIPLPLGERLQIKKALKLFTDPDWSDYAIRNFHENFLNAVWEWGRFFQKSPRRKSIDAGTPEELIHAPTLYLTRGRTR
ncbi:MAG: hypothetical protein LBU87_01850 [Lactobacillales bacterium]|jgi:hypothetical protein|nr:hypothetical protein [Lactobacillales bacterium]